MYLRQFYAYQCSAPSMYAVISSYIIFFVA